MSGVIKVAADFYPKRIYHCPCLLQLVKQIYHDDFRGYSEIVTAVSIFKPSSTLVFSTRVENNEICFLMCNVHMLVILQAEANYDCGCVSQSEDDYIFDELNKSYCNDCVKYYTRKVYDIFPLKIFNE